VNTRAVGPVALVAACRRLGLGDSVSNTDRSSAICLVGFSYVHGMAALCAPTIPARLLEQRSYSQ
jgi:hypothetical protein